MDNPDMETLPRVFADLADWTNTNEHVPDLANVQITWDYSKRLWTVSAQLDVTDATERGQIDALRRFAGRGGTLTLGEPRASYNGSTYRELSAWHWWGAYQITVWAHIDRVFAPVLAATAA